MRQARAWGPFAEHRQRTAELLEANLDEARIEHQHSHGQAMSLGDACELEPRTGRLLPPGVRNDQVAAGSVGQRSNPEAWSDQGRHCLAQHCVCSRTTLTPGVNKAAGPSEFGALVQAPTLCSLGAVHGRPEPVAPISAL